MDYVRVRARLAVCRHHYRVFHCRSCNILDDSPLGGTHGGQTGLHGVGFFRPFSFTSRSRKVDREGSLPLPF